MSYMSNPLIAMNQMILRDVLGQNQSHSHRKTLECTNLTTKQTFHDDLVFFDRDGNAYRYDELPVAYVE